MKNFFVILVSVGAVATLVSANTNASKDLLWKLRYVVNKLSCHMLHDSYKRNPTKSHGVSALSVISILAKLVWYSDDCNVNTPRLLKLFNAENKEEVERIFSMIHELVGSEKPAICKVVEKAFSIKSGGFTNSFNSSFAKYFGGTTESIDSSNYQKAAEYVNNWFRKQSPISCGTGADSSMFENKGLVFASYLHFDANFNHINNPCGITEVDFHVNKQKTLKLMGIRGRAFIKYAENKELDAKLVQLSCNGGRYHGIIVLPNKPENMGNLVSKLADVTVYDRAVAAMKPVCCNLTTALGAAHMVNKPIVYLHKQGLSLTGFDNILENDKCGTNVIDIIQEFHITASPIKKRGSIHSPKCRKAQTCIDMLINRPLIYYFVSNVGTPLGAGIFQGDIFGGDIPNAQCCKKKNV